MYYSTTSFYDLAEPGATDWVYCRAGNVAFQITGPATYAQFVIERSTRDPDSDPRGANPAPADDDAFAGSPRDGCTVQGYVEAGGAWWRMRIIQMIGGACEVSITPAHVMGQI